MKTATMATRSAADAIAAAMGSIVVATRIPASPQAAMTIPAALPRMTPSASLTDASNDVTS
jgi:hypothetical protein